MTKVFLDTNILVEYFAKLSQYLFVRQILNAIEDNEIEAVLSAGSFYTIAYAMEMELKRSGIHNPEKLQRNRQYLNQVLNLANIVSATNQGYREAVNNISFNDLEDSFQYQCAIENNCDVIVTINLRDFRNAQGIRILSPEQFVMEYLS